MDGGPRNDWTASRAGSYTGRTLRIDVIGDASLSKTVRAGVVRRVLLALSRFGPGLSRVTVRLSTRGNPLGGVDQRCRICVRTASRGDVRAEVLDGTVHGAVDRAAAQLGTKVGLALEVIGARPPPAVLTLKWGKRRER